MAQHSPILGRTWRPYLIYHHIQMPLLFSQARRRLGILYHLLSLCITIHLTTDWGLAQYSSSILLISDWCLAQYSSSIHPTTNWGLAQYSSSIRLITDWGSAQYSSCITSYDFSSFLLFSSLFFFFFFFGLSTGRFSAVTHLRG